MSGFKRHPDIDMHIQSTLLNAYRSSGTDGVEFVDPAAVGMIAHLTQKPEPEAIMVLHCLHVKYPQCPNHLVSEVDELIEAARLRAMVTSSN